MHHLVLLMLTAQFGVLPASAVLIRRQVTSQDFPGAVCNDGSPTVFYHTMHPPTSRQFLIYLEGGFFCNTPGGCHDRCTNNPYYCTSSTMPPTIEQDGIFVEDPQQNPVFSSFYKVFVHYCTSDMYIGESEPTDANGGYYFKGRAHVKAVINSIRSLVGLQEGDLLVVSGHSAGGRGVAFNCASISEQLPGVDVRCIVGAAIFYPNWGNDQLFSDSCRPFNQMIQESNKFWNGTLKGFDVNSWWKTFPLPLFIGEQLFDNYAFLYFCMDRNNAEHLKLYAEGMREVTKDLLDEASHVGLFLPGCFGHDLLRKNHYFFTLRVGPNKQRYIDTLGNWLSGQGDIHAWDDCSTRTAKECNSGCLGLDPVTKTYSQATEAILGE